MMTWPQKNCFFTLRQYRHTQTDHTQVRTHTPHTNGSKPHTKHDTKAGGLDPAVKQTQPSPTPPRDFNMTVPSLTPDSSIQDTSWSRAGHAGVVLAVS